MKKGLFAVLLAVAMVVPVFATDKGVMELDAKVGLIIEPLLMENEPDSDKYGYIAESTFSLGTDFYYYVMNNFGVGAGINYIFSSKMNDGWDDDARVGATNFYLSVKPVLDLKENKFIDKAYLIGQLGYGIIDSDDFGYGEELENGFYWGIGLGLEKCNVIVELMYSVNYTSTYQTWYNETENWTFRNIAINVGYKFNI